MLRTPALLVAATVGFCVSLQEVFAEEEQPTIARGYLLEVLPGHEMQFEAGLKQQIEWYKQNKETWHWHTWEMETGENTGQFVFRSPNHLWKDLDERSSRAELAGAHFKKAVRPHLASMHGTISKYLPKVSSWPEDLGRVPMVSVYKFHLNYGMGEEFVEVIGKIHNAIQSSDWGLNYAWVAAVSGSEVPSFSLVIPHSSWTDMAGPEKPFWTMMEEAVGKAGSKDIKAGLVKCVRSETSALARFRPELSYVPEVR